MRSHRKNADSEPRWLANNRLKLTVTSLEDRDFIKVLEKSLLYVCAFSKSRLIGFVNIAWDGGEHSFLLDTTVHPKFRNLGIGTELVKRAAVETKQKNITWLHVDYEDHLELFYKNCEFKNTKAGLYKLN